MIKVKFADSITRNCESFIIPRMFHSTSSFKKVYSLVTFLILMFLSTSSFGQLLKWNTYANIGDETTEPSVFNNANISPANLAFGAGIIPQANANRFGGRSWFDRGNTATGSTLAEAIAGDNYIEFVVAPNPGFAFTATSLVFNWDASATGPKNIALRSSADGFSANLGQVEPYSGAIVISNTINISGLVHVSTLTTFRVYAYGSGTAGFDTAYNFVNVQLNGTSAPEMDVRSAGVALASGATYDFGVVAPGTVVDAVFDISNLGEETLTLGASTMTGSPPFSLFSNYSSPLTGFTGSSSFTVRFSATAVGTFNGSISIPNNDPTGLEAPYLINFTGICDVPGGPCQGKAVSWNGSNWSPAAPTLLTAAVIDGDYDTSLNGNFEACSLLIKAGKTMTITQNEYLVIENDLTVEATGRLIVKNRGSLVMVNDSGVVTNNGVMEVQKTTSPYEKFDYTYWSTPVQNSTIGAPFSAWRTDYSFSFNTANYTDLNNDTFDDAGPYAWVNTGTTALMTPGKGYAIMAPTTGAFPTTADVTFSGTVNNGVVKVPLQMSGNAVDNNDDYNLIGNPYPSAISATAFISENLNTSGSLYFWTHVGDISASNPGPDAQNFSSADYSVFNLSGGTRASATGSEISNGYIASGQGFMVEANIASDAVFNNAMRSKTYPNTQFYRNSAVNPVVDDSGEKDRIWLNLRNAGAVFSQQLIGYFAGATLDADWGYDGAVNATRNYVSFYSLINKAPYRIQGRPAYSEADKVPLGYFASIAGKYTIEIDRTEGVLHKDNTNVYLEDKLLHLVHDLKAAAYTFDTAAGTFDDRFVLRYDNNISADDTAIVKSDVVVAADSERIKVKSTVEEIAGIAVYDLLGRSVFSTTKVSSDYYEIDSIKPSNQALIVRVVLKNGAVFSKKTIF